MEDSLYSHVICWLRCHLSFLLHSAIIFMCIWCSCSSSSHPLKDHNYSYHAPLTLYLERDDGVRATCVGPFFLFCRYRFLSLIEHLSIESRVVDRSAIRDGYIKTFFQCVLFITLQQGGTAVANCEFKSRRA